MKAQCITISLSEDDVLTIVDHLGHSQLDDRINELSAQLLRAVVDYQADRDKALIEALRQLPLIPDDILKDDRD